MADNRTIVTDTNSSPWDYVGYWVGWGSGVFIGSQYVLTAGHVVGTIGYQGGIEGAAVLTKRKTMTIDKLHAEGQSYLDERFQLIARQENPELYANGTNGRPPRFQTSEILFLFPPVPRETGGTGGTGQHSLVSFADFPKR